MPVLPRLEASHGVGLGVRLMTGMSEKVNIASGAVAAPGLGVRMTFAIG